MPKYTVTSPSGQTYKVQASSPEEARSMAMQQSQPQAPPSEPEGGPYTSSFPDVLRGPYDEPSAPQLGPEHPGEIRATPGNLGRAISPGVEDFLQRARERAGLGRTDPDVWWKNLLARVATPFAIGAEAVDTAAGNPGGSMGPEGVPFSGGDIVSMLLGTKVPRGTNIFPRTKKVAGWTEPPVNMKDVRAQIEEVRKSLSAAKGSKWQNTFESPGGSGESRPVFSSTSDVLRTPEATDNATNTIGYGSSVASPSGQPPLPPQLGPQIPRPQPQGPLPVPPGSQGMTPSAPPPRNPDMPGYLLGAGTGLGAAAAGLFSPSSAEAAPPVPNVPKKPFFGRLFNKTSNASLKTHPTLKSPPAQPGAAAGGGGTHMPPMQGATTQLTGGTPAAAGTHMGGVAGPVQPTVLADTLRDRSAVQWVKDILPQDLAVWKQRPESGAITSVSQAEFIRDALWRKASRLEAIKDISKFSDKEWIDAEKAGFDIAKLTGRIEDAWAAMPKPLADVSRFINKLRPAEKKYADLLGDRTLKDESIYIIPHVRADQADEGMRMSKRAKSDYSSQFRSTLGMFEKPRTFSTLADGIRAGEEYIDPRKAILYRLWASTKLITTGRYVESLKKTGTLFEDAKEAARVAPNGKPFAVEIIPGGKIFYTPTRQEALHIKHQLREEGDPGTIGGIARMGTWLLRNLNLSNPWPHYLKNMIAKYNMSGGAMRKVFKDVREYQARSNPQMYAEYQQFLPTHSLPRPDTRNLRGTMWSGRWGKTTRKYFDELQGGSANEIFNRANRKLDWNDTLFRLRDIAEGPHRSSGAMIFGWMDPGLKYARFKQYRLKGFSPQDAANQTQLDLIRYSTRSELMDWWKSIPLNFFTPWRVGTTVSLVKNFRAHPIRTAIWIASVDMLRESVYRTTGEWVHMPHDYVEGPIGEFIDSLGKGKGTTAGIRLAGTTAALGPGGGHGLHLANSILKALETGEMEPETVKRAFWGLAFVADPVEFFENLDKGLSGDPESLARAIGQYFLSSHRQLNVPPKRVVGKALGDAVGMEKSPDVEYAERLSTAKEVKRDLRKDRSRQYPYPSVEDIVKQRSK